MHGDKAQALQQVAQQQGKTKSEDEKERQVETAEHRCVPVRERREGRATGRQHPHLVAVPDRADGVEHDPAALLGVGGLLAGHSLCAAEDGQQDADAEVEALEDEVAGPEDAEDDEPEGCQIHGGQSFQ